MALHAVGARGESMARRILLSDGAIRERLTSVPQWRRNGKAIARSWSFEDFPAALAFINRVGEIAESRNHHPDIYNSWNKVTLTLTTHDAGGLTERDFELAREIDALSPSL